MWERSRKSAIDAALASRKVSAGRFHISSMVFNTEVWSCTTLVTWCFMVYGLTTTAGTRMPYRL